MEPEGDHGQIPPGPPHGQAPHNLFNGAQVKNMGKDDDDDKEDHEDIRKKYRRSIILYNNII